MATTSDLAPARERLRAALGPVGCWSFAFESLGASEEHAALAVIEDLGFPAIWFPESITSREAFAHASWMLAGTRRAVIATGIANVWARDAYAMANGARLLAEAYPERFLLGLGVSHEPSVARRGATYERPLEKMRGYLEAMDATPTSAPAGAQPWRVLAALGPRMLDLAAERALGAHPYFTPVEHTAVARERLGAGPVLAVELAVVLARDPAAGRRIARGYASRYLALANYANNLRRLGWSEDDLAGDGSDAVIDAVVAVGDVDAIEARVRAHRDAGADHVCVQVLTADGSVGLPEYADLADALLGR